MKLRLFSLATAVLLVAPAYAQLSVPSDGSEGDFNPTENVTVDLSQAASGPDVHWDTPGTGKGVYDPDKWAVVFKYRSVNIPGNVTVRFKNHPSRAPVVWLVSGDVTINGYVDVSGQNGTTFITAEPGPGGFRGGAANAGTRPSGGGFGPGGANRQGTGSRSSGSYATAGLDSNTGTPSGTPYGSDQVLPLIGGSGGAGSPGGPDFSGGAGGGAILIAARNVIAIGGGIIANGGSATNSSYGSGSGGAIRLIANTIQGNGYLSAWSNGYGGAGRIRVEASSFSGNLINNSSPRAFGDLPSNPLLIWPPDGAPTVRVVSVGTKNVPTDPQASLNGVADVSVNETNAVTITLETTNVRSTSEVTLRVVPLFGDTLTTTATYVSGDFARSTWTANVTLPQGYCAIQARVQVK